MSLAVAVETQLKNVSMCLNITINTLDVISSAFKTQYLGPVLLTVKSVIKLADSIKQNRRDCAGLLEQTDSVLNWIIALHLRAEELTLRRLSHIENFLRTLHKIHTFLEHQQDGRKIMKFFQQSQINLLLRDCKAGLNDSLNVLKIQNFSVIKDINLTKRLAEERHHEVLELIANLSDNAGSDAKSVSSSGTVFNSLHNSSMSFSMLPSEPKIFHGRESDMTSILELLDNPCPRVAILGPGGIGKTTLARSVLHHPDIVLKYVSNRFFVACDSATTKQELISLIGLHLGLETGLSGRDLIQHISDLSHGLLVLDNLETVWEPYESRKGVEDFLALIADFESLALVITMRGAERPAQVAWTHPLLKPLQPLPEDASLRIFLEIADGVHDSNDIDRLLALTDHVPLAIDLLAHLADSEGLSTVLYRWENEKTSLISGGHDQRSNLDMSIGLSLSSPRLENVAGAKNLLALLSLLPDGLSDTDLLQNNISIKDILRCKAALLRTSLAFMAQHRLKVLVPIREYMLLHHPPLLSNAEALFHNYAVALEHLYSAEQPVHSNSTVLINFANMQNIILFRLQHMPADLKPTIYAAIHLNHFSRMIQQYDIPLMTRILPDLVQPRDPRLEVCWAINYIFTNKHLGLDDLQIIIAQTLAYFPNLNDSVLKSRFYQHVGERYRFESDLTTAAEWYKKGLQMAISAENFRWQSLALERLAWVKQSLGDYVTGLAYSSEAEQFAQLSGSFTAEVGALRTKAVCLRWLGRYSECVVQYKRARTLLALGGVSGGFLDRLITHDLAELHKLKSEYLKAQEIMSSHLSSAKKSAAGKSFTLITMAELGLETGSLVQDVENNVDKAEQTFKQTGMESYLIYCDIFRAALNLREGNMLVAKESLESSFRSSVGKDNEASTYCLEKLGDAMLWSSPHFITPTWPTMLLAHAFQSKQKLHVYKGFQFLGNLALVEGDQNTASSLLTVALDAFTHMDVHRSRAECMLQLGNIAHSNGYYTKAEDLWRAAQPLFECSSQGEKVLLVDQKLENIQKARSELHFEA